MPITELYAAAKDGNHMDLRELLKENDPKQVDFFDRNSLHYAAEFGIVPGGEFQRSRRTNPEISHLIVMRLLLEAGVDPNSTDRAGNAPLHTIASNFNFFMSTTTGPCCDLLIERGANVDLPNENRDTPKDIALMNGNLEVLKVFGVKIEDVINKPDKYGKTMLEHAVSKNTNREQAEIKIKQLISHGAKTDQCDSEGNTIYDLAFKNFNMGIFAALKKTPRDFIDDLNKEGKAMIHYAAADEDPKFAIIKMKKIIELDANIDILDSDGKTSLMYAVISKNIKVIELLLEKGAKTDIKNHEDKTALDIAMEKGGDNSAVLNLLRNSIKDPSQSAGSPRASTFTTAIGGPGRGN